jgi:hypothetical protein
LAKKTAICSLKKKNGIGKQQILLIVQLNESFEQLPQHVLFNE